MEQNLSKNFTYVRQYNTLLVFGLDSLSELSNSYQIIRSKGKSDMSPRGGVALAGGLIVDHNVDQNTPVAET